MKTKLKTYHLNKWLPAITILIFVSLLLFHAWHSYHQRIHRITEQAVTTLQEEAWQLASSFEYALQREDYSQIQRSLAQFSLKKQSSEAILIDQSNHVFMSTHAAWRNQSIVNLFPELAPSIKQAWQQNKLITHYQNHKITVFIPVFSSDNDHAIRPDKNYLLILNLDIHKSIADALAVTLSESVPFLVAIIIFTVLLLYILHQFVTKPLNAIHKLIDNLRSGQPLDNPLTGQTLLYHIAQTLVNTGDQLHQQMIALSDKEQRLDITLQSIGDAVIVTDQQGHIIRMNQRACELTGWSEKEALGLTLPVVFNIHNATSGKKMSNPVEQVLKTKKMVELANHTVLTSRNGQQYHISDSAAPIRDSHHDPETVLGVILVFQDVTAQYQLRQQLREKITFLENLINLIPGVIYTVQNEGADPATFSVSYISRSVKDYTGIPASEWLHKPEIWQQRIHPDDITSLKSAFKAALQSSKIIKNKFRLLHQSGQHHTFRNQLIAVSDKQGNSIQIVGIAQDISDELSMMQQQHLLGEILDNSLNEILILDTDTLQIVQVNRGATNNLGYSQEALYQRTLVDIQAEMEPRELHNLLSPLLNKKIEQLEFETVFRRKNGTSYPVLINMQLSQRYNHSVIVAIVTDITTQKESFARIEFLAHHDTLTQLPNRILLNDRIYQALKIASRQQTTSALLYLDLDRFKMINDSLGHDIGDALLIKIASLLSELVRDEDTVSRAGGDEFTILLVNTHRAGAARVAQKIIDALSTPFQIKGNQLFISISIGICIAPENGTTPQELIKNADTAMYRAKENGRNQYQFFTPEMQEAIVTRIKIENDLRQAIARNELELFYQPQLDLQQNKIVGCEALLRWKKEDRYIPPSVFIPVAEESGQIENIGHWVLETAIKQTRQWLDDGFTQLTTAINLSALQFKNPDLVPRIEQLLTHYHLSAHHIDLEITESILMEDIDLAMKKMELLSRHGFKLSLDDFGTGYSSLSYLKKFPISKLKIDQSFIFDMLEDPDDEAIVDAIITLAETLRIKTIAEGVETRQHLERLRQKGCHEIQGYYFSKPVPAAQCTQLLQQYQPHS